MRGNQGRRRHSYSDSDRKKEMKRVVQWSSPVLCLEASSQDQPPSFNLVPFVAILFHIKRARQGLENQGVLKELKYCMIPNMYTIARTILFCLCLTGAFQLGLCSQFAAEQQSNLVNGVLKDLPTTECDMIVVSPSPIHGEISSALQIIYYI